MEVSPKTLREVEFREKMRGYHPEDVDHFLEQVAAGIEVLQDRLRQAVERAQRAEAAASEAGGADDTLRKTLVLAQRTADLAVQEAREQASRILASAEQQAQSILAEAEEQGRRRLEDAIAESRSELNRLETSRSQAAQEVEGLQRWVDEHKAHLQASLSEAMSAVERAGVLWPAPATRPLDVPGRRLPAPASPPDQAAPGSPAGGSETVAWTPSQEERAEIAATPASQMPGEASPLEDRGGSVGDEQALDDFFDDTDGYDDDRRIGGRLRRRR
ncbi:MAG TPA: DivIVA domain-containing protein [Acidimicrobiales bacterium]|nr:DivIVA domain-containing protein [Acidimicrobiales bacterium]